MFLLALPGGCSSGGREPGIERPAPGLPDETALQRALDVLTSEDGAPGALVDVRGGPGEALTLPSGTAELGSGRPMVGADGHYRVGSVTKAFTAAAVLLLAESGAIALDDPIDAHLPGVVVGVAEGAEIDGRSITIRQLLQHTSGLPNYTEVIDSIPDEPVTVEGQVALALAHAPTFTPPGSAWRYTNTGYLVLGMLVERVSGRPLGAVLAERLFAPLGLSGTYWPEPRERALRGPHAHNYAPLPDGQLADVSELEPTIAGAAGQLVSTPQDLATFWRALFEGDVLRAETLGQMTTTVPLPERFGAGAGYGLGLYHLPLSCGLCWGHSGDHAGVETLSARGDGGRRATVYITRRQGEHTSEHLRAVLDVALCSRR